MYIYIYIHILYENTRYVMSPFFLRRTEEQVLTRQGPSKGVCAECSGCCDECGGVQCFECVDTCERCATFLCRKCVNDVKAEACPCCRMSEPSTLRLCTDCVLMMWMKPTKNATRASACASTTPANATA